MPGFLWLLIWNCCIAAALAIAVAAVSVFPVIRRNPALRQALWLLVLVKLVTPPLVPAPVLPAKAAKSNVSAATTRLPASSSNVRLPHAPQNSGPADSPPRIVDLRDDTPYAGTTVELDLWTGLCVVWAIGGAVLGVRMLQQALGIRRVLRRAENDDGRLASLAVIAAERMRVQRSPQICVVNGHVAPLLWVCHGQPVVAISRGIANQLSDEQIVCVICHELAHYVRRDHWLNLFACLVVALFWWHPAVWWARREMRNAQELCCDSLVISSTSSGPRLYADTLLRVLELIQPESSHLPSVVCGFGQSRSIERRFEMIARGRLNHRLTWLTGALVAMIVVSLLIYPAESEPWKPFVPSRPRPSTFRPTSTDPGILPGTAGSGPMAWGPGALGPMAGGPMAGGPMAGGPMAVHVTPVYSGRTLDKWIGILIAEKNRAMLMEPIEAVATLAEYEETEQAVSALIRVAAQYDIAEFGAENIPHNVPRTASNAVVKLTHPQPPQEFIKGLESEDVKLRHLAAYNLPRYEADEVPFETVNHAAGNPDAFVRQHMLRMLGRYGEQGLTTVILALNDDNWDIRHTALDVLAQLGPKAESAVPILIQLLEKPGFGPGIVEYSERVFIIQALGEIGAAAKKAVQILEEQQKHPHESVRKAAAVAIEKITRSNEMSLE